VGVARIGAFAGLKRTARGHTSGELPQTIHKHRAVKVSYSGATNRTQARCFEVSRVKKHNIVGMKRVYNFKEYAGANPEPKLLPAKWAAMTIVARTQHLAAAVWWSLEAAY
jgi:hypothetical protein